MFNIWRTHYDSTMKSAGVKLSLTDYWKKYLQFTTVNKKALLSNRDDRESLYVESSMIATEIVWMQEGRPYYNFHMNLVEPALRMKLDKIPMNLLDVPRDFNVVNLRFQEGFEINGLLAVNDPTKGLVLMAKKRDGLIEDLLHIHLPKHERSIRDYIDQHELVSLKDDYNRDETMDLIRKTVQLYAITKFLADAPNDELIEYDVIKKLKGEYQTATANRRKEIERISRRKGHLGWNIGVNSRVLNDCGRLSESGNPVSEGRELTHSHIRTGHLHAVRFGPGKKNVKIMLYRPIRVRPDLEFKS